MERPRPQKPVSFSPIFQVLCRTWEKQHGRPRNIRLRERWRIFQHVLQGLVIFARNPKFLGGLFSTLYFYALLCPPLGTESKSSTSGTRIVYQVFRRPKQTPNSSNTRNKIINIFWQLNRKLKLFCRPNNKMAGWRNYYSRFESRIVYSFGEVVKSFNLLVF